MKKTILLILMATAYACLLLGIHIIEADNSFSGSVRVEMPVLVGYNDNIEEPIESSGAEQKAILLADNQNQGKTAQITSNAETFEKEEIITKGKEILIVRTACAK